MEAYTNLLKLAVGADDSNHAGPNKKGEIIVNVFSFVEEDFAIKHYSNRRDVERALKWTELEGRDYRYTILTDEASRHRRDNLVLVSSILTKAYLKDKEINPKEIFFYLDGPIRKYEEYFIEQDFPEYDVSVKGFTKKSSFGRYKSSKNLVGPLVIPIADTLANFLYSEKSLDNLLGDSHMVPISMQDIEERDAKLHHRIVKK